MAAVAGLSGNCASMSRRIEILPISRQSPRTWLNQPIGMSNAEELSHRSMTMSAWQGGLVSCNQVTRSRLGYRPAMGKGPVECPLLAKEYREQVIASRFGISPAGVKRRACRAF